MNNSSDEQRGPEIISTNEKQFKEELKKLVTESESVSGRDASAIKASTVELHDNIVNSKLSSEVKKKLLKNIIKLQNDVDAEDKLEKTCGRVIQLGLLFTSVVPLFLSFIGTISEYATRPTLVTPLVDMSQQNVVIIGGCGAMGSELGMMFASSGASVVLGCRDVKIGDIQLLDGDQEDEFEEGDEMDTITKLSQINQRSSDRIALLERLHSNLAPTDAPLSSGKVSIWPIDLESFSTVSAFADKYLEQSDHRLDLLVHAAATKEGCLITEDGYEISHQVNFIAPALLTQLLLPALGVDVAHKNQIPNHANYSTRIVHTTCDAAMQLPDWLPWPMRRIDPYMLPDVNLERMSKKANSGTLQQCTPLTEYANAKLSNAVHTKELSRRLSSRTLVSTHLVNPGSMDTKFGLTAGPPTNRVSARSKIMGYLPPVWISRKLWSLLSSKFNFSTMLLRKAKVGAQMMYHVCTSDALSDMSHPGGFYSDSAGVNVECGKAAWECSRLPAVQLPDAVLNKSLATQLWRLTDDIIRDHAGLEGIGQKKEEEIHEEESKQTRPPILLPKAITVEVPGSPDDIREVDAEWD